MNYEHITVEPVAGALGAEVSGIELSQPMSDPVAKELRAAWMEHQVLFLRDQDISIDQHNSDFGRIPRKRSRPLDFPGPPLSARRHRRTRDIRTAGGLINRERWHIFRPMVKEASGRCADATP